MTVSAEIQDSQTVSTARRESDGMFDDGRSTQLTPTIISDDELLIRTTRKSSYVRIIRPAWRCSSDSDNSDSESSGSASTDTRGRRRFYRRRRSPTFAGFSGSQPRIELEVGGCGGLKALLELELAVKHDHYQQSVSSLSSFYESDNDDNSLQPLEEELDAHNHKTAQR